MKKILFSMMALFATMVSYADDLKLSDVKVAQGKSATVAVNITSVAEKYRGYEFKLTLPEGLTASAITKNSERTPDEFTLSLRDQGNGVYQILVYNMDNKYISGETGAVAYITINADASTKTGEYEGSISNVTMSTDQSFYFDESTFKITVVEDLITLEETIGITDDTPTGNQNVLMKRTIRKDVWNTICLPFALDETQVKAAFGEGVKLADFNGCEEETNADEETAAIKVKFVTASAIEANHPYLIKIEGDDITEFRVDGVNVAPEENPSVDKDRIGKGTNKDPYRYNSFIGTYNPETLLEIESLFLSGNQFWYSTGNTKMKAFRGYFSFYLVLASFENDYESKISFVVDDEVTSINGFGQQNLVEGVYDLSGRKIQLKDGDLNMLQKGVYIIDGKKVTIK